MNGHRKERKTSDRRSGLAHLRGINNLAQSEFVKHRMKLGIEEIRNDELIGQERNRTSPNRATECYFNANRGIQNQLSSPRPSRMSSTTSPSGIATTGRSRS